MTTGAGVDAMPLAGTCDSGFARVAEAFAENFAVRDEIGAAVAVYVDGEIAVDLWGGRVVRDQKPAEPWGRDTIVRMMSINKAVTAICAHRLADHGLLDYERRVADYWPEFAQAGKESITVRTLMAGRAGLVFPDAVPDGAAFDWPAMVDGLARQAPIWAPGTRGAYHSSTYGHLVGELVRRLTGKLPGAYFREEIGEPLGLDYWFALPRAEQHRLSEILPNPDSATYAALSGGGAGNNLARAWRILPGANPLMRDHPDYLGKEMPSAFGRGTARAMAKLFAALARGGDIDGVRVLSPQAIDAMTTLQWDAPCALTGRRFRYCLGVYKNTPGLRPMGRNPDAFGHMGVGGSFVFADPERRLSFSYCTNFMCAGDGIGERCTALVEAVDASGR
ncbi:serine hydrolase domain-containing protein [Devosia sp.]|uniref:serine hydrolase domain-containing protein n=1 Tax=Devosia sp. TaxID=1871048 RepID=UPI002EFD25FB